MTGRQEVEMKIVEKIQISIYKNPSYIGEFDTHMYDKTCRTRFKYINYILEFTDYLKHELHKDIDFVDVFFNIEREDIINYISSLGKVSNSLKAVKFAAIKCFFDFLEIKKYIDSNPCDKIKPPKDNVKHKITYLEEKEIKTIQDNILNNCGKGFKTYKNKLWMYRDLAIINLLLFTGLRVSSMLEINIEDIDFLNSTITVTEKGNTTREVHINQSVQKNIKDWIEKRELILKESGVSSHALFLSNRKKRISARTVEDILSKYTYNINKHISPHKLRSTCGTLLYVKTGDINLVSNWLGHKNIQNTLRYVEVLDEKNKMAANALEDVIFG